MGDIKNYENLANAIILQAVRDYRMVLKCLKRNPGDRDAQTDRDKIERFFRSQWYQALTDVDGEKLIGMLTKEVMG